MIVNKVTLGAAIHPWSVGLSYQAVAFAGDRLDVATKPVSYFPHRFIRQNPKRPIFCDRQVLNRSKMTAQGSRSYGSRRQDGDLRLTSLNILQPSACRNPV
jgi:hypothetical protein